MTDVISEFAKIQKALQKELEKILLGKKQNSKLEQEAQDKADEFFYQRRKKNRVILDTSGIEIVGCVLAFDIGRVMVMNWKTKFYPDDKFAVMETEPSAIPLGYVNGCQLYIVPQKGLTHTLVARIGMGHKMQTWAPAYAGMPSTNTVHFVALERAKALGYLPLLQLKH